MQQKVRMMSKSFTGPSAPRAPPLTKLCVIVIVSGLPDNAEIAAHISAYYILSSPDYFYISSYCLHEISERKKDAIKRCHHPQKFLCMHSTMTPPNRTKCTSDKRRRRWPLLSFMACFRSVPNPPATSCAVLNLYEPAQG